MESFVLYRRSKLSWREILGRTNLVKSDTFYSVTHVRNSEIKQMSPLFSAMLWDIDLIFGMWVYNHKLQIKFEIRSGWMIFGQLTVVGLWNLTIYLVVTTFFYTMIWDIDLIFGMWVYSDELPIKFEFRSDWMILD